VNSPAGLRRTTDEWLEAIGSGLRGRRIRAGLTQAELARRANVSLSTIQKLESKGNTNLSTLVNVARVLGLDDWLEMLEQPTGPDVSPMHLLRERQKSAATRRRVRPAKDAR